MVRLACNADFNFTLRCELENRVELVGTATSENRTDQSRILGTLAIPTNNYDHDHHGKVSNVSNLGEPNRLKENPLSRNKFYQYCCGISLRTVFHHLKVAPFFLMILILNSRGYPSPVTFVKMFTGTCAFKEYFA